jgi:hypothetical protein
MKLLSTFYSNDGNLAPGWWATLEYPDGRRVIRHLWEEEAGPDFDDLASLVTSTASAPALDLVLVQARLDRNLVRRTKPLVQDTSHMGWVL